MTIAELRRQHEETCARIRAMVARAEEEDRDFDAEENRAYEATRQEVETLETRIRRITEIDALEEKARRSGGRASDPMPHTDAANTRNGLHRYSLLRLIRAADPAQKQCHLDGLELEVHQELRKRRPSSRDGEAYCVPWDLPLTAPQRRWGAIDAERRDLTTGTAAGMVYEQFRAGDMIEFLRNRMLGEKLGVTVLTDINGTLSLPRQSGAASGFWVAEGVNVTLTNATSDSVDMTPKSVGGAVDVSRSLLKQTSIDAEMMTRTDLVKVLAIEIDRAIFHGSGSGAEPLGLAGNSSVTTIALGTNGAAPAWANILAMEGTVASGNADGDTCAYVTSINARTKLKATEKFATAGNPVWESDNSINGYPAWASRQISQTLTKGTANSICSAIFFGNWSEVMVPMWGGLEIVVDPYSRVLSGGLRVVAFQELDIKIRHNESFVKILDALTT